MKHLHERLLAARGISLGEPLNLKGLRVHSAYDHNGAKLLLRGRITGPSWPSISLHLESLDIESSLIEVGKIWILTADTEQTRSILNQLSRRARQSLNELVLVPDVGFVSGGAKRKFDPRSLIGPIAFSLMILGFALIPTALPEQIEQKPTVDDKLSCALDLSDFEMRKWIAESISVRDLASPKKILVNSELGLLDLEIEQTLGSTQSVTGSIECNDGRTKQLHYRLDASANGTLVELGQKLNP